MEKPPDCYGCPIAEFSYGFVRPEGEGTNGVVILGQAGGWNEYIDALPFRPYAQAGSKLEEAFREASSQLSRPVTRSQFLIYNVINCSPKGDKLEGTTYEQGAIAHCSRYVDKVVGGFHTDKVKTILALGNIPLKYLTGVSGIAKESQSIAHLRGFVYQSRYGLVVPSLHPAGIKRGKPGHTPLLVEDLKKALAVANGTYTSYKGHPSYKEPNYQRTPSLDEAWSFYYRARDSNLPIAYDIETKDSPATDENERDELTSKDITLIQFSLAMHEGIAFPWKDEYITIAKLILELPNIKAGHNVWEYDDPILKSNGVTINGKVIDTMWLFKHWQPGLPRGLQNVVSLLNFPFPWKHLSEIDLEFYGCADVDAVQHILHYLPKLMQERGVWTGYVRHVLNLNPIFVRASERGIPVSDVKREQVKKEFEEERAEINAELQKAIPDEIRNIRPRRKDKETKEIDYGYINEPKVVRQANELYEITVPKLIKQGKKVVQFDTFVNTLYHRTVLTADDDDSELVYANFKNGDSTINRWCIIENFKASSTQLQRYLKYKQEEYKKQIETLKEQRETLHHGRNTELTAQINNLQKLFDQYEVPLHLKTKRPTTSKQELEEIFYKTGDEILEKAVRIRSLDTNLTNYLPNWQPHKDGRVHPIYSYSPPTGQINSRKPNSQNCSKHTEIGGERFRAIIEAPPGYCFVEADKKSFHIAIMGYNAKDKSYIRFSQIDPHSIFGSYINPNIIGGSISLKWSDADIKLATSEFKKRCKKIAEDDPKHGIDVRQSLAKPTILGNQLELGARKLQRQNQRYIKTIEQAEGLQKLIAGLFPKPEQYKAQIKEIAHKQRYLINEFGRIQYFYDVFNFFYDKKKLKWTRKDGEGARQPIAFRVQSPAFGMITEELLELDRLGACEEHNFMVTIHDSLLFMPEIKKRDKCIELLANVMNKPCKYLVNEATGPEGLKVAVEISVGSNWRDMKEITL